MPSTVVRISQRSHRRLRELAQKDKVPMQRVIDKALENYERKRWFEDSDKAYQALRSDPEAWKQYQAELAEWDCTLMDGLDPNEVWLEDGTVIYSDQKTGTDG